MCDSVRVHVRATIFVFAFNHQYFTVRYNTGYCLVPVYDKLSYDTWLQYLTQLYSKYLYKVYYLYLPISLSLFIRYITIYLYDVYYHVIIPHDILLGYICERYITVLYL